MARHHSFSKRSRESRKAMSEGAGDQPDHSDTDEAVPDSWLPTAGECDLPPDSAG